MKMSSVKCQPFYLSLNVLKGLIMGEPVTVRTWRLFQYENIIFVRLYNPFHSGGKAIPFLWNICVTTSIRMVSCVFESSERRILQVNFTNRCYSPRSCLWSWRSWSQLIRSGITFAKVSLPTWDRVWDWNNMLFKHGSGLILYVEKKRSG